MLNETWINDFVIMWKTLTYNFGTAWFVSFSYTEWEELGCLYH